LVHCVNQIIKNRHREFLMYHFRPIPTASSLSKYYLEKFISRYC
jgi:hypothetical protein